MLSCNSTATRDWTFFLSHILPLVNRSAGLVHRGVEEAEAVTVAVVTVALEPASSAPPDSNHTEHVYHQYSYSEGDVLVHGGHEPPDREPIPLPRAVLLDVRSSLGKPQEQTPGHDRRQGDERNPAPSGHQLRYQQTPKQ
ncbi:hypothetical protein Baya_15427 [Bagarius yarrelli]|uniref:Uncharacterized protein n=1 Tax=Bagarius yarrelli TaxID=175774 RepID=A0A556VBX9_BAGYA|nr:hypothetical protein Baya_15427 [Bagarius yarrelli]